MKGLRPVFNTKRCSLAPDSDKATGDRRNRHLRRTFYVRPGILAISTCAISNVRFRIKDIVT
jgi:hypothetical protein